MKHNPFVATLTIPDFAKLWTSQVLSQVSLNMINFVIILRIFEATGSTIAVGLVWLFYAIPALLLGPISGTIVDLASRRALLIVTNFSQSVLVLLYLLVKTSIWPIYTIVFLYSLLNQIYIPAEAAALPGVVPKKLLPSANSIFLFTVYGAFIAGFGLAGPLVALVGKRLPFVFGTIMLFLATIAVSLLAADRDRKKKISTVDDFWLRFKEGYLFLKDHPYVLFPLLLMVVSEIMMAILAVLSPALAVRLLGLTLVDASVKLVVPLGIGALAGAFLAVKILKRSRKKHLIRAALVAASLELFLFGLILPEIPPLARLYFGQILIFLIGASFVMLLIPAQTMLQEKTPVEFRGRVFGVLGFLITLASLLPVLLAATVADLVGEVTMLVFVAFTLGTMGILSLRGEEVVRVYGRS